MYAEAYNRAYVAGKKGTEISEISGKVSSVLSDSAIAQAYRAGEMVASANAKSSAQSNAKAAPKATTSKNDLLGSLEIGKIDSNKSYYKLDDLGISKADQTAWVAAGIAQERNIRGEKIATVNTTVLQDELKRREKSSNRSPEFLNEGKIREAQATIDSAKSKDGKNKKGTVIFDGDRNNLSGVQKQSLIVLKEISKALGITFHVYESENVKGKYVYTKADGTKTSANGWYDPKTGEIWIDINAGNNGEGVMIFTAAHELTHFIKDWSPAKFKVFADFLIEQYQDHNVSVDELVQKQIDKAAKNNRELSWDEAYEEVIADSCESFLRDSNAVEKIAALKQKDASLAGKIKQFISNMLKRLRELMSVMEPQSAEGKIVSDMTSSLEKLYELWTDALIDAGEAYSGAEGGVDSNSSVKEQARSSNATRDTSYNAFREMIAKLELDEVSKKLGKQFPLSADFDATMIADKTPLQMETVVKNSVTTSKGKGAFVTGKKAFTNKYGSKTSVHIKQIGLDAELYSTIATESISKAIGHTDEQSTLDVIPHLKEILNNSICLSVERVVHTDNKRTSLFGYRLYNFYWYQDGKNKTLHCLVSTVVQNTDNAEGHVFKNIENVTIGRGLPGKNADMSAPVNGDTYSISQLYQFVKGLERKDGGIKYSQIEKQTYGFEYDARNDGELYSDRDPDAPTNRELLANALATENLSPSEKGFLTKYKNKLSQIEANEAEISQMKSELADLKRNGKGNGAKAVSLENKISALEKQNNVSERLILNLEATKPIRDLIDREKAAAYKEGRDKLKGYREKVKEREKEIRKEYQESRKEGVEGRHKTKIREKIRAFKDKLQNTLKHPTDHKYIPSALAQAMIDVCELIDTDTELYNADGTVNKARNVKLGLQDALNKWTEDKKGTFEGCLFI